MKRKFSAIGKKVHQNFLYHFCIKAFSNFNFQIAFIFLKFQLMMDETERHIRASIDDNDLNIYELKLWYATVVNCKKFHLSIKLLLVSITI